MHETTHLEVIARLAIDEVLVNLRDRDVSLFRTRSRPLSRVLRGALVAVRCVEAVESLQRSGRWTELGAHLFEDLVAHQAELQHA